MPTYILRPDGDDKADWTEEPVGNAYDILGAEYTFPDSGSPIQTHRASNYIYSDTDSQICRCDVGTTTLAAGEQIAFGRVWIHYKAAAGRSIKIQGVQDATSTTWAWGLTPKFAIADQSALDAIQPQIQTNAGTGEVRVAVMYLEVQTTTTEYSRSLLGVG